MIASTRFSVRQAMACSALVLAGCASDFPNLGQTPIEGVPGVTHLGTLEAAPVTSIQQAQAITLYGEVGPTGTPYAGGFTFEFVGTGGEVCVWVDPEIVSWSPYLGAIGDLVVADGGAPGAAFAYPDNTGDDGDLDLRIGQSVFYSGRVGDDRDTPSARMGDFLVPVQDSLGNTVNSDLDLCASQGSALSGRGVPESCTLTTIEGVRYTVAAQTFSVPQDDYRLGYGMMFVEGSCDELSALSTGQLGLDQVQQYLRECVLTGEAVIPGSESGAQAAANGFPEPSWIGAEVPVIEGARDFENVFCNDELPLQGYCEEEARTVLSDGLRCAWGEEADPAQGTTRCFCGDPDSLPRLAD